MKFTVKKVDIRNPAIANLLLYLQKQILPADQPYEPTRGHWWIAYTESGKPVGFAGLVRSTKWTDTGYLCRAGVMDGFTGHGIQKRLIKSRLAQAKRLGWNWCITDTTDNPASSNSLISCGFKMYTPANPWGMSRALYWKFKVNQDAIQRQERKSRQAQGVQP